MKSDRILTHMFRLTDQHGISRVHHGTLVLLNYTAVQSWKAVSAYL